jgi:hypothetical protein
MTQGWKSRTARALACLTAALLALAVTPVLASAQSGAEDEYELNSTIPSSSDTGGGSGGQSSSDNVSNLDAGDGGGAPILLIGLGALAAVCTGVAIWRMRRDSGSGPGGPSQGAAPPSGAASERSSA